MPDRNVPEADARSQGGASPWKDARTFGDLLGLGRRFLSADLDVFPGWGSGTLDDESDDFEDVLLAANAGELLSVASQPGRPFGPGHDGLTWGGRAFVGGFCSVEARQALAARAEAEGLWLLAESPRDPAGDPAEHAFQTPVGLRAGTPYLVLGSGARKLELEIFQEHLGAQALAELESLPFVWLLDPSWGRRDALRRALGPL